MSGFGTGSVAGYIYNTSTGEKTCGSAMTIDGSDSAGHAGGAYPAVDLTALN
jgi:hypothetical protein